MKSSSSAFYAYPVLWIFATALIVRLIPELMSYPYPIGFDTVFYAWRIQSGTLWYSSTSMFSTWLFYAFAIPIHDLLQVNAFVILSILPPLIYGLNAAGVYYFARKALLWSPKYASLAGFLFMFQLASLRLSWDLYRNVLGLGVLLFALPWVLKSESWKDFSVSLLLSILAVFSHELVAATLVFILGGLLARKFVRRELKSGLKIGVLFSASLILLLGIIEFGYLSPLGGQSNVVDVHDVISPGGGNLGLFVNYLDTSYFRLFGDVSSLFLGLYLLLVPLVLVGFFRHAVLDLWVFLLMVGVFHVLVIPFFAFDFWPRLMFMLVYPFTFYALNGVKRAFESGQSVQLRLWPLRRFSITKTQVKALFLMIVSLGMFYVTFSHFMTSLGPYPFPPGNVNFPGVYYANTVLVKETGDLAKALMWLNTRLVSLGPRSSGVIVQDALLWWTRLYLSDGFTLFHFFQYANDAVQVAVSKGYSSVFFVWWTGKSSLYNISVPSYFVEVFRDGGFSVYEYNRSGSTGNAGSA